MSEENRTSPVVGSGKEENGSGSFVMVDQKSAGSESKSVSGASQKRAVVQVVQQEDPDTDEGEIVDDGEAFEDEVADLLLDLPDDTDVSNRQLHETRTMLTFVYRKSTSYMHA